MQIRCPECHNSLEVVGDDFSNLTCPSCGSEFSLIDGDTTATHQHDAARTIGHFELIHQVGVGAFGSVWKARDKELDRTVAVKIPRRDQLSGVEADAFFREARAAAQLRHPQIVGIHEVGRDGDTIYIVSDFIEGANLKEWLSAQRLSAREAAELVARVAEALHHAHEAGVVHRDLKPGNIMLDLDSQPHITDFGLAKRESGEISITLEGKPLGTPNYMPPEQAKGEGHRADRRSDVYSMGVILFELLTGEVPFRGEAQMVLVQIQKDEPPRPRRLNARIPRDLETITLKCLQKEPGRRYHTAQHLADDLRHWLEGKPIVARPVGRIERGWRWTRRNPLVAGLAAAVLLALTIGTGVSSYFAIEAQSRAADAIAEQARADAKAAEADANALRATEAQAQATQQAQRALTEAEKSTRVAAFLAGMFEASAPQIQGGVRFQGLGLRDPTGADNPAKLTARALLDRGAKKIVEDLKDQPEVQAALLDTIGNVYSGLGLTDKAEPLLQRSLDIRRELHPGPHLDTAASLASLSITQAMQLRFDEAIEGMREVVATRKQILGDDRKETMDAKFLLGFALISGAKSTNETESLLNEVIAWRREHLGAEHPETGFAMAALAATLAEQKKMDKAAALFMQATAILTKNPETKNVGLALAEDQQARMMWRLQQRDAAVNLSKKAVEHFREFAADDHVLFGQIVNTHLRSLKLAGRDAEAKEFCRDWLRRLQERDSPHAVHVLRFLVPVMFETDNQDDLDEAERLCREWVKSAQQPPRRPIADDIAAHRYLARVLSTKAAKTHDPNDVAEAESAAGNAVNAGKAFLQGRRGGHEGSNAGVLYFKQSVFGLAKTLQDAGRLAEAESLYRETIVLLHDYQGDFTNGSLQFMAVLGDLLKRQGKYDEAERLYRECVDAAQSDPGFAIAILMGLGDMKKSQSQFEAAAEIYREGLALTDSAKLADANLVRYFRSRLTLGLGDSLVGQEKKSEAEGMFRKVIELNDKSWAESAKGKLAKLLRERGADDEAVALGVPVDDTVVDGGGKVVFDENTGRVVGAIEGERLKVLRVTSGKADPQQMGIFKTARWSGNEQLFWVGARPGDRMELELNVPEDGEYEIMAAFTMAADYAIIQLALDDHALGEPIDLYNHPDVICSDEVKFPSQKLTAGQHVLSIEITGANPAVANAYMVGLDYLRLRAK